MAKCGLYMIVDDTTRKVYIGATGNLDARESYHRSRLRKGKHQNGELQKAYCAGHKLRFVTLIQQEEYSKAEMARLERQLIEGLRANEPEYGFNRYR